MSPARSIQELVERQARAWQLQRLASAEIEPIELPAVCEGPFVTISRQIGSGGDELAALLSSKLGWQVYDQEILADIASEIHASEPSVARFDEHAVGPLDDYLAHLIVPDDPGQATFLRTMVRVIRALGRRGQAIVLGRGANFVLDARFGVRVRVVAPTVDRAARLAGRTGVSLATAERQIKHDDAERRAFVKQAFRMDIEEPLGYDLILNMHQLCQQEAADAVIAVLRARLSRSSPPHE